MARSILSEKFQENLQHNPAALLRASQFATVTRCQGLLIEAKGQHAATGTICWLECAQDSIPCEVVGFEADTTYLMPLRQQIAIEPGMRVRVPALDQQQDRTPVLDEMLGRVVNGLGEPIDGGSSFNQFEISPPPAMINPMRRHPIDCQMDVGIRSINAALTVGRGQRMGLFAGSGVGKSVLLGMIARFVRADVVVVGLIGERGREVQEFVLDNLGEGIARAVVVACPADDSASLRLRGARLATQIAERFRDQGKHVLLLMDSLTRVSQAQREIGLALGEPPSSRGYPPSAFACLPSLVERAGNGSSASSGSITAFYTVLMEEDDLQDPIVDAARAILDGHVVLSRQIAEQGIYPAIDIGRSISRVMTRLTDAAQLQQVNQFRHLWSTYLEQQDLINIGAYQRGSDPTIDAAINHYPRFCDFLRQAQDEPCDADAAVGALSDALKPPPVELRA